MWIFSPCPLINFGLSLFGAFWTIPSSCHNEDLYENEHNTWNTAHSLNHMTVLPLRQLPLPIPPPNTPCASRSYRKLHYPTGRQSTCRIPAHPSHRKRKWPYMVSPEIWRYDTYVKACQRQTDRDLKSQSVRLITVQRIYNICKSQDRRILGNSGCAEVESPTNESL